MSNVYNGLYFKTPLEATWAAFFDLAGWTWHTNPVAVGNWKPDFVVSFKCDHSECCGHHTLLVSVLPIDTVQGFGQHPCTTNNYGVKDNLGNVLADDQSDLQIISDSILVGLPTEGGDRFALSKPTEEDRKDFIESMRDYLQPFFTFSGSRVHVGALNENAGGWLFLDVHVDETDKSNVAKNISMEAMMALADHEGASRIFAPGKNRNVTVGVVNQHRFLTRTQGKLCAMDLLRLHGACLDGQETLDGKIGSLV